jgi:hypothetical protein
LFFAWDITVPANRLESTPLEETLKLTAGVITRLDIKLPAGCNGLVKVHLLHDEFQLVPLSRGEWVTGDDETIPTEAYYELASPPYSLKFVGCSPGTTYDHVVTIRVSVLPKGVASMLPLVELLTRLVNRIFGVT